MGGWVGSFWSDLPLAIMTMGWRFRWPLPQATYMEHSRPSRAAPSVPAGQGLLGDLPREERIRWGGWKVGVGGG